MNFKIVVLAILVCLIADRGEAMAKKLNSKHSQPTKETKQVKESEQFKLTVKDNSLYLPIKIEQTKIEPQLTSSTIPSWLFTDKAELCLWNGQETKCSKTSQKVKCQTCQKTSTTTQKGQFYEIEGQNKINLTYVLGDQNGSKQFQTHFIEATKVTLKDAQQTDNKLQGMINIADWQSFSLFEKDKNVFISFDSASTQKDSKVTQVNAQNAENERVVKSPKLNLQQNNEQQGAGSLKYRKKSNQQQQKVSNQLKSGYIIANEQQKMKSAFQYSAVEFSFIIQEKNSLLQLPKETADSLKALLLEKNLLNECKLDGQFAKCKKKVIQQNFPIDICFSQQDCMRVNANSMVSKVSSKKFEFLFTGKDDSTKVLMYPDFLQYYSMCYEKGILKQVVKNPKYQIAKLFEDFSDEQNSLENPTETTPAKVDQKKHSYVVTLIISIAIYCAIAAILVVVIKCKTRDSFVSRTIDFAFRAIASVFHRQQGYEAPPAMREEIDDSNTVNYGYEKDNDRGKQMFWERNSVEGI